MIQTSPLKILMTSSHADARVAVSWMIRQSFPDAQIPKAETIEQALQLSESERPDCVVVDASLAVSDEELSRFSKTLWQRHVPLIVIREESDASATNVDRCPGIAARLVRSSANIGNFELAIRKALELASMTSRIETLEQETLQLRTDNHNLTISKDSSNKTPTASESSIDAPVVAQATPIDVSLSSPKPMLERPKLVTAGLEVSTEDEQELAGRVQKHLLPPGSPRIDGFDIAGLTISAETTGGDYYDYLPMSDDVLCVSIGECSGRGLAPAMLMASLRAYLRVLTTSLKDITDVVSQANTLITDDIGDEEFIVTLMLFQIDMRSKTFQYVSAGHQAYFLDNASNIDVLHSTGMPLGLRDETVIPEGPSGRIRPGEILLLASDGVQKMTSGSGEQFGTQRMLNLVLENRSLPARVIANYLRKACSEFASPQFRSDDVTIVIIKGDDSVI